MREIYHNGRLTKPILNTVETQRAMRILSLGLGGGCFDGKDTTRCLVVISEVVMGSFMLKDGVLNSAEHVISFDLKPAQCVPIRSREECQRCGEWWG
ncbi:hypothetical protein K443DRAFT_684692 [Laccaria amethystina LaAM-08-1]|uniref:Uncharacterized protein n=1 Tax=Laccaria amethystina LaAM-08-1 TaxID=1095629 RepID=A0A0C9X6A6_9AGAR|nr:hypothetical protein K443DRAFT_684692 [Laccaria amethystina LaAM-08-1]